MSFEQKLEKIRSNPKLENQQQVQFLCIYFRFHSLTIVDPSCTVCCRRHLTRSEIRIYAHGVFRCTTVTPHSIYPTRERHHQQRGRHSCRLSPRSRYPKCTASSPPLEVFPHTQESCDSVDAAQCRGSDPSCVNWMSGISSNCARCSSMGFVAGRDQSSPSCCWTSSARSGPSTQSKEEGARGDIQCLAKSSAESLTGSSRCRPLCRERTHVAEGCRRSE
jgi:hypothetical protein